MTNWRCILEIEPKPAYAIWHSTCTCRGIRRPFRRAWLGHVSCERAVGRWTSCSVAVLIRNAPDLFFDSVRASYSLWKRSPPPLSNSRRLRRRLMRGAPRGVWSATGFANTVHRFRRWFTTAVRESYCCRCPVCQHRRGVQRNPHETITCDRKNGTGGK